MVRHIYAAVAQILHGFRAKAQAMLAHKQKNLSLETYTGLQI